MEMNYTALDLEMTGLNAKLEKIIEIGAVRVRAGKATETFSQLVNPAREMSEQITAITGITDEMLRGAPYIEEVLPGLLDFLGDDVLVGHRILFDFAFVKRAALNQKLVVEKKALDTLKIARQCLPDLPSKTLGALCKYYQIPIQAHRASADALATHELYQRLCADFELARESQPLQLIYKAKKEVPIAPPQKERLMRMCEYYQITLPVEIGKMTKNEASRMIDKLILKYGRMPRDK